MDRDAAERRLIVEGFPRSGNTFLRCGLDHMYPEPLVIISHNHTVNMIKEAAGKDMVVSPVRDPLKAISSWYLFQRQPYGHPYRLPNISSDVNYYIRYVSALLEHKEDILFVDFTKFIQGFDYVAKALLATYGISTDSVPTTDFVKEVLIKIERPYGLPQDNKEKLLEIQEQVRNNPKFTEALDLYGNLSSCLYKE
jgi:hypothetical protein